MPGCDGLIVQDALTEAASAERRGSHIITAQQAATGSDHAAKARLLDPDLNDNDTEALAECLKALIGPGSLELLRKVRLQSLDHVGVPTLGIRLLLLLRSKRETGVDDASPGVSGKRGVDDGGASNGGSAGGETHKRART